MAEFRIGRIEHYYPKAHAAVVRVDSGVLHVGDQVHIVGPHEDFWEEVTSLQMDHKSIAAAKKGQEVGLAVVEPVHAGAEVYRLDAIEA